MLTGRSNGDRRSILVEVSGIIRPDLLEEVFEAIRELDCHPIEGETSPDQPETQLPLFNVAATLTVSEMIDPGLAFELALVVAERIPVGVRNETWLRQKLPLRYGSSPVQMATCLRRSSFPTRGRMTTETRFGLDR